MTTKLPARFTAKYSEAQQRLLLVLATEVENTGERWVAASHLTGPGDQAIAALLRRDLVEKSVLPIHGHPPIVRYALTPIGLRVAHSFASVSV